MLQAESQDGEGASLLRLLAESPQELERGLSLLEASLRITPDCVVDLLFKHPSGRLVVALGESGEGVARLLGRAVTTLVEMRRMRSLLGRLFRQEGVSFDHDPRVIVVASRFSDALLDARDWLHAAGIELAEVRPVVVDGVLRVVVAREVSRRAEPVRAEPVRPESGRSSGDSPAAPLPPTPAVVRAVSPANGTSGGRTASFADELQRKIRRISDDIEEEVDGGQARFLLHDQLLATITAGEAGADRCGVAVGDDPERRRTVADRGELNAIVDDIVRRYFTLTRQLAAKSRVALVGSAQR